MKNQKFHARLQLINEARQKIARMEKKNVFVLDVDALSMIERLSNELQVMLSENAILQEKVKLLSSANKREKSGSAKNLRTKSGG